MIEVYFKLSSLRRKERGITMSLPGRQQRILHVLLPQTHMNAVTQKCLSTKYAAFSGCPNPLTTPGIRSPMMIK